MSQPAIRIVPYQPEFAPYFDSLNRAWIEELFRIEPIDDYVLTHPAEAILDKGGQILFALYGAQVIGTVALRPLEEDGVVELTKMAVDRNAWGMGAGKLLCMAAIDEARNSGATRVILYSNTRQSFAINIYRKLGFMELPLEQGIYERANIKMELSLGGKPSQEGIGVLLLSYSKAHEKIMEALANIPREIWSWKPPHNKWTIRENIVHLADSEANSYIRCRRFLAEPGSQVLGYDQDKWAAMLQYNSRNTDDALELFRLLRKMSYELVKDLPYETWDNTIEHSENGRMTMWEWLRVYENHTHIHQMQRVFQEWRKINQPAGTLSSSETL